MSDWFPIADEFDVVPRHVARTSLLGRELVAWRADDGHLNVWENRCLHRGVRLSIGINDGAELICRYHGWRYANRTAGCTYIPAHPADSPARTIHGATFPVVERYGLVWSSVVPDSSRSTGAPDVPVLDEGSLTLRARPVRAPAPFVMKRLRHLRFLPTVVLATGERDREAEMLEGVTAESTVLDDAAVAVTATSGSAETTVVYFVQPVGPSRCVVRPVHAGSVAGSAPGLMRLRQYHADVLGRFVEEVEALAPDAGPDVGLAETPVVLAAASERPAGERLLVSVARKWTTAAGIAAFELEAIDDALLPTPQPGDHIDVFLPGDLVRQYSLVNGPGETNRYVIGVKRAAASRGGSATLHDEVAVGDALEISAPRNSFSLRRNHPHTLLIAGGIGVTPVLSMAQSLASAGLAAELHYFAHATDHLAFPELLDRLGDTVYRYLGLDPEATVAELEALLDQPHQHSQVYACGPPLMLDAIRRIAGDAGWPDDTVHFEYFENTREIDHSSAFTVELARSALRLEVPAGSSILEVVRAHGVNVTSSCEQGACGTCAVGVIDGEPMHQDVYLTSAERAANDSVLTCVSRAATERLVLDL